MCHTRFFSVWKRVLEYYSVKPAVICVVFVHVTNYSYSSSSAQRLCIVSCFQASLTLSFWEVNDQALK